MSRFRKEGITLEKERVLLAACQFNQDDERFDWSLDELKALTETADGIVEKVVTQKREKVHSALYLGRGKVDEIKEDVDALEIDLIVFNDELSGSQLRNLTDYLGVRVLDRTQLILDIFAMRAQTREGKLQVELAQLQYSLPRLVGKGVTLSRLGAGIGTRGPGETKLETDRRHIKRRIDEIKTHLKAVVLQRDQYRKRRRLNQAFQIAIVGYTNAGKSTTFNRLTNSEAYEENQLFATLDPLTRSFVLPSGFKALITDTVGFIQDLPTTLVAAFRSTLEEVTEANFILHVVDASHPDHAQHEATVNKLLSDLKADHLPMLTVYNKEDLLTDSFYPSSIPSIVLSAHKEKDIEVLRQKIEEVIKKEWINYDVSISTNDAKLLNDLNQQSIIIHNEFDQEAEAYRVEGYIHPEHSLYHKMKNN